MAAARRSSSLTRSARLVRRAFVAVALAGVLAAGTFAALWAAAPDPAPLGRHEPDTTALIEQRRAEAREKRRPYRVRRTWMPLERFPPHLVAAVLASEDANFFGHGGLDWGAMREAAEHDLKVGRFARGASTLTQQLAKNLWFGTEKSLGRKAREAVLAMKLEQKLGKRRILALYLNVVELGDGVFGFEAGARARFGVGAPDLSPAQAVVLASMLPAPLKVDLSHPSTWLQRRARRLLDTLHAIGRLDDGTHRRAAAELDRILAGPRPADDREEPPEEEPPEAPAPSARGAIPPEPEPAAPPLDEAEPQGNGGMGTAGQEPTTPKEQGAVPQE